MKASVAGESSASLREMNAKSTGNAGENANEPEGGVSNGTPFGRRAVVEEISGTVAFLLGDDSTFITGTEITIDGGLTAK